MGQAAHIGPKDEITEMDEPVVMPVCKSGQGIVSRRILPMPDGRRTEVEQPVRKQTRPGRMAKPMEVNAPTKALKNRKLRFGLPIFVEAKEIDLVIAGEFTKQMKRALESPSGYGIRSVRINNEDAHRVVQNDYLTAKISVCRMFREGEQTTTRNVLLKRICVNT
tara:strand:- start:11 stop:505 length:495 start_codon:yes stop_codon:yes gene_type:complete